MGTCRQCGAWLPEGAEFCPDCRQRGASLQPASTQSSGTPPPFVQSPYATPGYVGDSEGEQEQFLSGFSWGPGCGIYFLSRAMLYFWLGLVVIRLLSEFVSYAADGLEEGNAGAGLLVMASGLAVVALAFGLMYWAGKVARRRRWSILRWRDFEHFRTDERSWDSFGKIGWVLNVIVVVIAFIIGFLGGEV